MWGVKEHNRSQETVSMPFTLLPLHFSPVFHVLLLSSIPSWKSMVQHYPYFLINDLVNNSKALLPVFITLFSSSPSAYNLACTTTCTHFPASVPIYFSFTTLTRDKLTKPLSKPNSAACKQTALLIHIHCFSNFFPVDYSLFVRALRAIISPIIKKKPLSNRTDHHHPIFWHLLTANFFRKGV